MRIQSLINRRFAFGNLKGILTKTPTQITWKREVGERGTMEGVRTQFHETEIESARMGGNETREKERSSTAREIETRRDLERKETS